MEEKKHYKYVDNKWTIEIKNHWDYNKDYNNNVEIKRQWHEQYYINKMKSIERERLRIERYERYDKNDYKLAERIIRMLRGRRISPKIFDIIVGELRLCTAPKTIEQKGFNTFSNNKDFIEESDMEL
jgi:hypothetical protein